MISSPLLNQKYEPAVKDYADYMERVLKLTTG
jgi:hypothetical protein